LRHRSEQDNDNDDDDDSGTTKLPHLFTRGCAQMYEAVGTWKKVTWSAGREKAVKIPFISQYFVSDCPDKIATVEDVIPAEENIVRCKPDQFGQVRVTR
jgi:hypothetical protein